MFAKKQCESQNRANAEYIPLIFNNGKFAQPIDRSLNFAPYFNGNGMAIRERFYLYQQYVDYLHRNAIIAVTVCVAAAAICNHDKTTDARKAIASKKGVNHRELYL